jgi:hypothetical protein
VTRLPDGAAGVGIIPLAAAWGSSFIFIRVALPALGAVGVAEARALLGGLAVTGLVLARGRRLRFGQGLARYTVLGALASAVPYILMCYATGQQGAALTAVFFATVPLFSAGIEAVWFRRRPSLRTISGLAAGFAGVVLIVGGASTGLSTRAVVADAAALGAAVFSALGANYSRRYFAGEDAFTQTAGQSATAAVLMIPIAIAAPSAPRPGAGRSRRAAGAGGGVHRPGLHAVLLAGGPAGPDPGTDVRAAGARVRGAVELARVRRTAAGHRARRGGAHPGRQRARDGLAAQYPGGLMTHKVVALPGPGLW